MTNNIEGRQKDGADEVVPRPFNYYPNKLLKALPILLGSKAAVAAVGS